MSYITKILPEQLLDRAEKFILQLEDCKLCCNECSADRTSGNIGDCGASADIWVSSASPHFGEEPPLVGSFGSGTIFFTNCSLSCVFCQNYDISQQGGGTKISIEELADVMLYLQRSGCHNINFVTPTHYAPQIVRALSIAVEGGLSIPLVYNTSGYDSVETIKMLDGIIDIYMPDIKYSSDKNAFKYSGVKNYWSNVKEAVREMHRQTGDLRINEDGIAERGLLIRHLVLPGDIAGTKKVLDFIAEEISINSYINLMEQYRPAFKAHNFSEINRVISKEEFDSVFDYAKKLGFGRGLEF